MQGQPPPISVSKSVPARPTVPTSLPTAPRPNPAPTKATTSTPLTPGTPSTPTVIPHKAWFQTSVASKNAQPAQNRLPVATIPRQIHPQHQHHLLQQQQQLKHQQLHLQQQQLLQQQQQAKARATTPVTTKPPAVQKPRFLYRALPVTSDQIDEFRLTRRRNPNQERTRQLLSAVESVGRLRLRLFFSCEI